MIYKLLFLSFIILCNFEVEEICRFLCFKIIIDNFSLEIENVRYIGLIF